MNREVVEVLDTIDAPQDIIVKCKTKGCNEEFVISVAEQQWLKENNLGIFTHCKACRIKRREQRNGK